MKKVAIQGTLGSYHDIAAHKYFEGEGHCSLSAAPASRRYLLLSNRTVREP